MRLRPLTSYAKAQTWVGRLLRNRDFQLKRKKVLATPYLDLGCGRNCHENLTNLDYLWHPGVDVCWDIQKGIPFSDGSLKGIFSEHCFEHFPLEAAFFLMRECRRVLVPGGILRIVVPDAGMYLDCYHQRSKGTGKEKFPFEERESFQGFYTPMLSVNRIFYQDREQAFGHRTMYDHELLQRLLLKAGFTRVEKRSFRQGANQVLLVDAENRRSESLYVEAS